MVYLVFDQNIGYKVVLKQAKRYNTGDDFEYTLFQREFQTLQRLKHSNIMNTYDLFKVDDDIYLVVEFIQGWTLEEINKMSFPNYDARLKATLHSNAIMQHLALSEGEK